MIAMSQNTSSSGIPNKSAHGIREYPWPDATQLYSTAGPLGNSGIPGSTCEDEDQPEDTDIPDDECEIEMVMSASSIHPVAIICTKHNWRGSIS